MESTGNKPGNSNELLSDLCSSCRDVISSILSIGEPSYLGELLEESFDCKSLFDSPFDDKELLTEIDRAKTEEHIIRSPRVTTTADKKELERIQLLVEPKDVKASTFQETNHQDEIKKETFNITAGHSPASFNADNGSKRCKSNSNMNNNTEPATSNICGNKNTPSISNTVQAEMSNEESERIIQEFRKQCDEILNPPEINTLPSIEQYKLSQFGNEHKLSGKGISYNLSNTRRVRRTESSVGALMLSTYANAEKRSILDRRKTILLTLNRLLNLTSYITNKGRLGQMSGANTFNKGPKNQN